MPQSLMAFLAMSIAIMLSMSQFRSDIQSYQSMVEDEYEIMANAVALEALEIISASTDWDDLDVWDDSTMAINFSLPGFQESFDLGFQVQFVDAFGNPSGVPTTTKEVEVVAMHDRYTLPIVTHARLISD